MKKNVLIFPCGSEIGLEIYRSLCLSTHFNIIGASSAPDHGAFVYANYVEGVPYVDDPNFLQGINRLINEHDIHYIIPAHDSVVLKLAEAEAAGELQCEIVTSPLETCQIARSKAKTYEVLSGIVPVPIVVDIATVQDSDLPLFLKPDVGQGSKGTQLVRTIEELTFYTRQTPGLLVLEYLPGEEFTVDCFTAKNGKLLFCEGRRRKRISNGISVSSVQVDDKRFLELAQKLNEHLSFRGVWFFQVKENQNGELVMMEIAPRIAGTMGLVRCKGVNLVLLSLFDRLGYELGVMENNYELEIDRALENRYRHNIRYSHVYLDFDDVVIFDGKVNPSVMAFVYQCMNRDIKVHLLTRHKEDLEYSLKKYRLNDVFDEIIWIRDDTDKHSYIKEDNAIFIDDSYAERKRVHENLKIPVFDLHMLESLTEAF